MSDHGLIHVLLVEDNEDHVALFRQLLSRSETATFQVEVASSMSAGLARLASPGIDLIILDLTLPDSTGMVTFLRFNEVAREIPIVVLSGVQDVTMAIETVQLGAQDYLVKGHVDNHVLLRSLHYAIERKRGQLQLQRSNESLEERIRARTLALQEANARLESELAERRKAEAALLESNLQLASAIAQIKASQEETIHRERMLALGRMARGIAHDFNNSLAPILGFSELLLLKPETLMDPARTRDYIELIHSAAQSSARVVARLREFYRHRDEPDAVAPLIVNDLVIQAISITQPQWKDQALADGITIDVLTEMGDVPTISGNENEIREALVNLIFNAVDAIPKRGTITLRTEVQGRWLVITVSDDGIGMSEEVKASCLEPFFSTKPDEGLGLGLGSVHGIVRRHGGGIDIHSEPGRGTSIAISFPLEREISQAARKPPSKAPAPNAPLRILVVEDEPLVREVLGVYLAEDHHDVVLAVNGRDGLEKFQTQGPFDLVMTDRAMPELSGDQLALEIRKLRDSQMLILLTGFGDLMSDSGEHPAGIDLIVGKPFTIATLRSAIAQVTGR